MPAVDEAVGTAGEIKLFVVMNPKNGVVGQSALRCKWRMAPFGKKAWKAAGRSHEWQKGTNGC